MSPTLQTILAFVVLFVVLILTIYYTRYRQKSALREVVKIMRTKGALDFESAMTEQELGLAPKPFLVRIAGNKDYKPQAMQALIVAEVIQITHDGRIFLSEEKLVNTKLQEFMK